METQRAALDDEGTPSAETVAPDEIEPLDAETLAAILAVDRNADPILSAIIRAGLLRADEEERQEAEHRASDPPGSGLAEMQSNPKILVSRNHSRSQTDIVGEPPDSA